jgi:hypothetical protein
MKKIAVLLLMLLWGGLVAGLSAGQCPAPGPATPGCALTCHKYVPPGWIGPPLKTGPALAGVLLLLLEEETP